MPRIRGTCRPEAGRLHLKSTGKGKRNLKGSFERAEAQMGQAVLQLPERHADKLYTKYVKDSLKNICRWHNSSPSKTFLKNLEGASLVAQWLRIGLPMQGTRVQAPVWEDPTCRGATRPVSHNY